MIGQLLSRQKQKVIKFDGNILPIEKLHEYWKKQSTPPIEKRILAQTPYHFADLEDGQVSFMAKKINRQTGENEGWTHEHYRENHPVYGYSNEENIARQQSSDQMWQQVHAGLAKPENAGIIFDAPFDDARARLFQRYGFVDIDDAYQIRDNRVFLNPKAQQLLGLGDNLFLDERERELLRRSREILAKKKLMPQETLSYWNSSSVPIEGRDLFELPRSQFTDLVRWL